MPKGNNSQYLIIVFEYLIESNADAILNVNI